MWQFIISGYIPGTETQLSFSMLVLLLSSTATVAGLAATLFVYHKRLTQGSEPKSA